MHNKHTKKVNNFFPLAFNSDLAIKQRLLNKEIENFDKSKLQKQVVHYVSSSKHQTCFNPKVHSFIMIGHPTKTHKKGYGHIYFCGTSIMHASYRVSPKTVLAAFLAKDLSPLTKEIIYQLRDTNFPSVEHFLRAYLLRKAAMTKQNISKEALYVEAAFPNQELQKLVLFNDLYLKKSGAILPSSPKTGRRLADRILFENGKTINKIYPNINPWVVRDLFDQQQLYAHYMDEKAGIGKATENIIKYKVKDEETKRIISSMVDFKYLPKSSDAFSANCNKSCGTLLQKAENISAKLEHRPPQKITTKTKWGIGSKQRMFLWDPLEISLRRTILNLLDKNEIPTNKDSLDVKELAHKKHDIFHIICTLPPIAQKKALSQALDREKALGKIFQQKTEKDLFKTQSIYYLWKIKHKLIKLAEIECENRSYTKFSR